MNLMERIKRKLLSQGRETWNDFLKCLNLFTNDVVSRVELVAILEDILGPHREVYDEFKAVLAVRQAGPPSHPQAF